MKILSKKYFFRQKTIKIALFVIITSVAAPCTVWLASSVSYERDRNRFMELNSTMEGILRRVKDKGGLDWKYVSSCNAEKAGDLPTGQYICTSIISSNVNISSINELNSLQNKYYTTIDSFHSLDSVTRLRNEPSNDFGKKFVVSSAEKTYTDSTSDIECIYLLKLNQSNGDSEFYQNQYGSDISNNKGIVKISFSCIGTAKDYWYEMSNRSELPSPDAPLKR